MKPGIYSYAQLKGKIKVGDIVRAVWGKSNPCTQLGGTNQWDGEAKGITKVDEEVFWINGCSHSFENTSAYLEVLSSFNAVDDEIDEAVEEFRKKLVKKMKDDKSFKKGDKIFWISSQGFIKGATYRNDEQWRNRAGFLGLFKTMAEAEAKKKQVVALLKK